MTGKGRRPRPDAPSAKPAAARRGKGGALNEDDLALWRRVVADVSRRAKDAAPSPGARSGAAPTAAPNPAPATPPTAPVQPKPPGSQSAPQALAAGGPPAPTTAAQPRNGRRPSAAAGGWSYTPAGASPRAAGPSTPGLDDATARRLGQGRVAPEARIDLHGMTADRAHRALIGFILQSHSAGRRCVLVITGKGTGRPLGPEHGWRDTSRAGVLKSMTPDWLRQPPIGALVVGQFPAHRRHGGDGALYVYLRKNAARR